MKKVLIVGNCKDNTNLEASYRRAIEGLGYNVMMFDPYEKENLFLRLGKIGKIVQTYLPLEIWRRLMNKKFVIETLEYNPDIVFIVCNAPIIPQSLAFLKVSIPAKIILLWPDPILSISNNVLNTSKLYDMVVTFSEKSIEVFSMFGFKTTVWVPLAGDKWLHFNNNNSKEFDNDICFVGAYRPDRAQLMEYIKCKFPQLKIEIYGTHWEKYKGLLKNDIRKKPLRGQELSEKFNKSFININIFDETGLGAANMRFFEISMARGLQICSQCSEMENSFIEGEHIFYYKNNTELAEKISYCLNANNSDRLHNMRENAHKFVVEEHQYINRVSHLLHNLIEN